LFLMRLEEAFEGLSLEQRAPEIKSELRCASLKLFYQIPYLRDPRGNFAVSTVSNSPVISTFLRALTGLPSSRSTLRDHVASRSEKTPLRRPRSPGTNERPERMRTTLTDVAVEI
jgi:hypothetical protein